MRASPSSRRRSLGWVVAAYVLATVALQGITHLLITESGALLWFYPAALSVTLLVLYGPKMLPAVILARLPMDLLLRDAGYAMGDLLAMATVVGCGHALAAVAFRKAHLSPRLRRAKDVAGFLLLALLGPALAALFLTLLGRLGLAEAHHLPEVRSFLVSDALGVLTLGPALLFWAKPLLIQGRGAPRRPWSLPTPSRETLLLGLGLLGSTLVVVRFSDPGTLDLKYLLFLPLTWIVVRQALAGAILALPALSLLLSILLRWARLPEGERLGVQSFLLVLAGMTLFLGSAVEALNAALEMRQRRSRHLTRLLDSTGAIPWELEVSTGTCRYLGMAVERCFPWPQEAWLAEPHWRGVVHPEDLESFLGFLRTCEQSGGDHQLEFRLRTPGGQEHWVRVVGAQQGADSPGVAVGFLFDIHAHKRAEEHALRASLKEKDLLLREIHHRVKNNLQVVSSLLRLQSSTQSDPGVQRALQEAQERVHAIALIHQKLKHAPDFSQLDLPSYVTTLCERLVRSFASVPTLIDLQVRVDPVDIGPEAPVPLGLILNELVANALQHAFPAGTGGCLEIDLHRDGSGWITLRVADSGAGLPDGVDLDRGGLGFQLVRALADQLGGSLELERRRGASFLLHFQPQGHRP